ncbi:MAG: ABC transporter substrate-binding protein, partial [Alcaligenaceae bacterium]
MLKLKIISTILPLILLATAGQYSPAVQAQALAKEQVLRFGLAFNDIATLDPHFAVGSSETPIVMNIFQGLIEFPPGEMNGDKVVAGLAEKWSVSPDAKQWTFELRKGVKWHKGMGEFTSADVKYSIERVQDETLGSPFRGSLSNVEQVEILGPYTVLVKLKQPDPTFTH